MKAPLPRALAIGLAVGLPVGWAVERFVDAHACRGWMPRFLCDEAATGWATAIGRDGWLWAIPVFAGVAVFLALALRR